MHREAAERNRSRHLRRGLRIAMLFVSAAVLTFAALSLPTDLPAVGTIESAEPAGATWAPRELPREWRYERKAVQFDDMYGANVRAPSVEHMYRERR
jgi:hypothetical protein